MALVLADRVLETTTTTGSGTITLAGAEPGYQSFSVVGDGNQTYYVIAGDTEWEVGIGTYTSSGTTLSRDTVLSSSDSGNKVTFSAGAKKVFITYPSEKSVNRDVSGNISASSGVITDVAEPVVGSDAANKAYVDNVASAALHVHEQVVLATPANSGRNDTYNNGTAGVSATLTATANGTLVIDSTVAQAAQRVLIKDCDDQVENGIYVVTTVGNGSTPYVMTRSSDADTSGESNAFTLDEGSYFFVTGGTTQKGAAYVCNTSTLIIFGTTSITFAEFSQAQVYSAGNGILITLGSIALNTPVTVASGGTGLTTSPANGQLLIGNGASFVLSTLTAGSGVSITNSAGSITLSATGSGGTVVEVKATSPLASSGGTSPTISIANSTGTGSVVLDQGATISSATITAAISASITTITGTSANITTVSGTTARFSSAAITQLSGTSAGITTVSGTTTTFSSGTITQFGATSATIASVSGTNVTYSNGNFTSATVTTISGTTATYGSATLTNLGSTSANITTLTGTTFGTTTTTQLRGASAQITNISATSLTVTNTIAGSVSGNAGTATKLQTARTINGVSFDGSANITITANTPNAATFNNAGAGAASGTTFDGSAARTISYNTIGAPSTTGTNASGTWGISITGNAATATDATSATNSTTTSQRLFTGDIGTTGQGRFTGWYSGNATTAAAVEVGYSGGEGYVLVYNRATSTYGSLNLSGSASNLKIGGSTVNVTQGTLQQGGVQVALTNSANVTTLTGTNITFTSGTITNLNSTSANITTLTGTTFGATATTQLRGASAQITTATLTSANITTSSITSLGVNTAASGTAGEIRATNNITAYYSDARLKDFKGKIGDALYKVSQLNGYYFTENAKAEEFGYNNKELQVGVSAQEVKAILPEVIAPAPFDMNENNESKSGENYMTVRYEKLVPLLIEAIKELKAEVEALKAGR
jgi:hypothetical protein